MENETEIKYGRIPIEIEGKQVVCGYATFTEAGRKIELISVPYGGLYVKADGKTIEKPGTGTGKYAMLWAKIAGWIGNRNFARQYLGK